MQSHLVVCSFSFSLSHFYYIYFSFLTIWPTTTKRNLPITISLLFINVNKYLVVVAKGNQILPIIHEPEISGYMNRNVFQFVMYTNQFPINTRIKAQKVVKSQAFACLARFINITYSLETFLFDFFFPPHVFLFDFV